MAKNKLKKDGNVSRQGEGSKGRRPLKFTSPEELEQYIQEYYIWCKENDMFISVTGLAWWLGTNRQTLNRYEFAEEIGWLKRLSNEDRRSYSDTIKDAKRYIEMLYENRLYSSSTYQGGKFSLMNNYSWVDKVQHNNIDEHKEDLSEEEIKKQLEELGIENQES